LAGLAEAQAGFNVSSALVERVAASPPRSDVCALVAPVINIDEFKEMKTSRIVQNENKYNRLPIPVDLRGVH
jgi:hypothetical protein